MIKKYFITIIIILFFVIAFLGAYDVKGVEDISYVIAIGIDKCEKNPDMITLTLQTAKLSAEEKGGANIKSDAISVDCPSINVGISMINSHINNEINLSHCTVAIFSSEIAKEGIKDYINTLSNNIEIRPTCNIIISHGKASEFIDSTSDVDNLSSDYYTSFIESNKYTGYVVNCQLLEFYSSINEDIRQPIAIYGYAKDKNIENLGIAVFKDSKFVGRLTALETICHNIITNNLDSCTLSLDTSLNTNKSIDANLTSNKKTSIHVDVNGNTPTIYIDAYIDAKILSAEDQSDRSDQEVINIVENDLNNYLEYYILQYLYKTSSELDSDIVGFEGYARSNYLTLDEFNKINWKSIYKNSIFYVQVHTDVTYNYLFPKD